MYYTGFADEAASDLDGQIEATQALGWNHIEAREIEGTNIHDLPRDKFDAVFEKLDRSGIRVNCFGSAIANWATPVDSPFADTLEPARRAAERMHRMGTKLVRVMSFAFIKGKAPDDQMEEERFERMRELQKIFSEAGVTPVHENCMTYGGMGWAYSLRLLENVPGLKLVFDTGNAVGADDMNGSPPYPKQSSWDFYSNVKEHVAYVHIKDATWDSRTGGITYTFPGEGDGDIRRILTDLLAGGYDGGLSIEPHMQVVFHDESVTAGKEERMKNYIEYGNRLMKLVEDCRAGGLSE